MPGPPGPEGLKRSLRLGAASLRITGHALGDGLRSRVTGRERDWQPVADELRATLSGLRGPVIKIGQTLSQWREVLPAPIVDALGSLRTDVEPVPWPSIRARMTHELGEPPEAVFAWIDQEPLAAASLGQVHRAQLPDGTAVVVKAQFPDMDRICAADLRQLRRLLPLGRLFGIPSERLEAVHSELKRAIERELDYEQERAALERFRQRYAERDDLILPRAIPGYCTRALLTLTEEPGESLTAAAQWPAATRQKLASSLISWAAESMLSDSELHADPHAGNFGFRRDGRVVVYDFGCTMPVATHLNRAYADGFRALQAGDPEALERAMQKLGSRRPGTPPPWSLHRELIRIVGPAIQPDTPWDFGNGELHREAMALTRRFMEWLGELQPPAEAILINRTLDGHYWTLYALGVELPVDRLISPRLPDDR